MNASYLAATPAWNVAAIPRMDIGGRAQSVADSGPESLRPVEFFRVAGVRHIGQGQWAVADDGSKRVRVFDSLGQLVRSFGRQGMGPGEFQNLWWLSTSNQSVITVYDALIGRLTSFSPVGEVLAVHSLAGHGLGSFMPVHAFDDESVLLRTSFDVAAPTERGTSREVGRVVTITPDGSVMRVLGDFPGDERVVRAAAGGVTLGDPPFPRKLLVAATETCVWIGRSVQYEIECYDRAGRLRRLLRVARREPLVTDAMIRHYRDVALARATGPGERAEWSTSTSDDVFPERLPPYDILLTGGDGSLWVRDSAHWPDTLATWNVFAETGQGIAHLRLPGRFVPTEIVGDTLGGVWRDEDGVEHVRLYVVAAH